MAINRIDGAGDGLDVAITNGDLQALRQIFEEWGFKDEESVLRYALAVMTKVTNSNKALFYENEQGEKIGLFPAESVKKQAVPSDTDGT